MVISQTDVDEWSMQDLTYDESAKIGPIHFEPCYQPGDDSIKEKLESLWHQAASLSEEIVQRTYVLDTQEGIALCSRTIGQVYQGKLGPKRHLLVSVITHVICSLVIERLLLNRWQTITEKHRRILQYMYGKQLELNLDISERWRANLYTIMVQDHYITDDEIRVAAQDFANAVAKTLAVQLAVGSHYTSFLRLVGDALLFSKEVQLTPAKYDFYAAIEDAEFDDHFMESVNLQGSDTQLNIAFVVFPGVVRTTDCNEFVLDPPAILYKPKVFLEPSSDGLTLDKGISSTETSSGHEINYYSAAQLAETDLGAGFSTATGTLKHRCISHEVRQFVPPDNIPRTPEVYTCSSIQELTEALGCSLLISDINAQSGYLQHKRQFLRNLGQLPNVSRFLLIRSTKYVKRETVTGAEFDTDKTKACEDLLDSYGDAFVSRIDTGTEYLAIYSIQLFAEGPKRQELLKMLSALQDHDVNVVFARSRSSIWSQLIKSQAMQVEFHEMQTKIKEEETKDSSFPEVLNILGVYRYAQDVVSHPENWPSVISVAYTGYEKLKDGDILFAKLDDIRTIVYGRTEASSIGKSFLGLIGLCTNLHLQINAIKNLLQIYSFWDPHWQDIALESKYSEQIAQVKNLEFLIQRFARLLKSSQALNSYEQECNPFSIDISTLGKRPQLRVALLDGNSQSSVSNTRLIQAIYSRIRLTKLEISGGDHVQNITLRYASPTRLRECRSYGLPKHAITSGTTRSLTLQPNERMIKLEKITKYNNRKGGSGSESMLPCDTVNFLRLTTSQEQHLQIGNEEKGSPPEVNNFGPGRFLIRLKADVDSNTSLITSLRPVSGSFEIAEWL